MCVLPLLNSSGFQNWEESAFENETNMTHIDQLIHMPNLCLPDCENIGLDQDPSTFPGMFLLHTSDKIFVAHHIFLVCPFSV